MTALATLALADVPATSYYVIKTKDLQILLPAGTTVGQLKPKSLTDLTVAHGYFEGRCGLYLKTKQFQFRIDFSEDSIVTGGKRVYLHPNEGTHRYALSMYSQVEKKRIFQCSGNVNLRDTLSASKNWQTGDYTILFKKENLKK